VHSGGAFQNRVLFEGTSERLADEGLRVLVPGHLPPNDGRHLIRPGRDRDRTARSMTACDEPGIAVRTATIRRDEPAKATGLG